MSFGRLFLSLAIVISIAFCALGMPNVINYQGKLTDNTGAGITDSLEMSFRLFNDPLVGAPLWTELHTGANKVFVHKGLFDVALGAITPINLPFDATYYLEITVDGNILAPRVLLTTSPYSYRAAIADSVVGGSGGDTCLWADHSTDPLIFAKNNDDVIVRDDGDNLGDIYVNMDHSAFNSAGIYVYRDGLNNGRHVSNIYAYRTGTSGIDNGGTSWDYTDVDAAVKGYTLWGNKYTAAIVGYNYFDYDTSAAVLGAKQDGSFFGALGYSCDGNMYSGYFYGEAVHFHPMSRPLSPVLGDIYTDETSLKMYFFNGVDWVDMTATPGGGASQWEDAGAYKRVIGNDKLRAYESGQNLAYAYLGAEGGTVDTTALFITDWASGDASVKIGVKAIAEAYGPADAYGVYAMGRDYPGGLTGGNKYGVYACSEWGDSNFAVYGTNLCPESVFGDYGFQVAVYGDQATGEYAGFFNGLFHIAPGTVPLTPALGDIYTNGTDNKLYFHNGTSWVDLTAGGGISGSGTANVIPLWTPDGSTLGNSRLAQDSYQIILSPSGSGSMQSNLLVYCDDTSDKNAIFGGNLYGSNTPGTSWNHNNFGAGVYGLNEINASYHAGIVGSNWGDYGDHTAGVVGSNSTGAIYGALFYDLDGAQYAGYFSGDVSVTGKYFDTSGDAGTAGQILSSTGIGTDWIAAPSASLWTDAGAYISANTNPSAQVYDEGQTYGLYYQGSNQYGVFSSTSNSNPGASGVYGYVGTSTDGTGYGYTSSISAVKGHCLWGNAYHFGLQGDTYSNDTGSPTAGVIGTFSNDGSIWGTLAYKHTDASVWAGYFNGNVHITGDLTIDGDYLHDHWGESWTGTGLWGFTLRNTTPATDSIYIAGNGSSGIKVIHYNSFGTRAIEAYEGPSTTNYYSYGALGTYADYTGTRGNIVNAGVYGKLPNNGGGGAAVLGIDNNTLALEANHYAGYFVGKVKVDGSIDAGQNPFCITLTAGENIALGDIVAVSTTADLTVIKALTGSETVIGVATESASSGAPVRIAIGGAVQVLCNAAVTRGNFVRCGGVAGQAINSGTTGQPGDFGIFLQTTAGAGLAWMTFKHAEIY